MCDRAIRMSRWVLGGLIWISACCVASDAFAQSKEPGRGGERAGAGDRKAAPSERGRADVPDRRAGRGDGKAVGGAGEPSADFHDSIRKTVERRRQRRARRQQNAADDTAAVGAIVPWPMPPALIVRHTREVHEQVGALLYGLRYVP